MVKTTVRGKTIHQNQITGEHGAALVKLRAHDMGFLYTPYGPVEAGIDGIIELRDSNAGEVGGRLVAVQVKTTENGRYTAETDDAFEYLCEPADIAYWQQLRIPTMPPGYSNPNPCTVPI
jgi:hypothetical protein